MTNKTTNLSKDQIVKEARAALTKKVLDNLNEGPGNFRPGSQAGRKQRGAIRRGQPIVKQSPEAAAAGKAAYAAKKQRGVAVQGDQSPRKFTGSNRLRPIDAKGNNDRFRTLMQKYRTKVGPVKPKQIGGGSDNGSVGFPRKFDANADFTATDAKSRPATKSIDKETVKDADFTVRGAAETDHLKVAGGGERKQRKNLRKPQTPKAEDPKASWKDTLKWATRDPKKNKEIDDWNAGKSDDKPGEEKSTPVHHVDTEKPRYHGRKHEPTTEIPQNQPTATEEQPKTGGKNVAAVKAAAERRRGVRTSARINRGNQTPVRVAASTEIVKNGRMALAEKVLSELTKRDYVDDRKAAEKEVSQAKKKGKLKPKVTTVKGTSKGPEGHSRANTLGHSDAGKYDKEGKPAKNPKDRGADQSAEAVAGRTGKMSIKDINKSGVGGHRDKELSMALKSHRMKNPVPPSKKKKKKKATKKSWIDDTMSDINPTDY